MYLNTNHALEITLYVTW